MNKADLIAAIADKTETTKANAGAILDALGEVITEALGKHEEVTIPGVGKFAAAHRAARTVRNPRTGETNEAPAHYAPVFKPASALREAVRNGKG